MCSSAFSILDHSPEEVGRQRLSFTKRESLFGAECDEAQDCHIPYSVCSMTAMFIYCLMGTFRKVIHVLMCLFYVYSTVGVQVFGGRIVVGQPSLKGTDFAGAGYSTNNFNDFVGGLIVMFELIVVNNCFIIAAVLASVAPSRRTSGGSAASLSTPPCTS